MTLHVEIRHDFGAFALDAAFSAPQGVAALFGGSGSGKTTIVNAVAGLFRPDFARILLDGEALTDTPAGVFKPAHHRHLGYVFQEGRLFPHLSVRGNLDYARRIQRLPVDRNEFDRVVDMLGIGHLLDRRPAHLSGGEKQRVAIGRALLSQPRLLLLDEPLAALDERRKAEIMPYVERLRDQAGVPILYVSHSVAEIARLATTVVLLDTGRVVRSGPAGEVLSDPESARVVGLREAGAVLDAAVVAHHADGLTELRTAGLPLLLPRISAAVGGAVRVRVQAQDVMIALSQPQGVSALNVLPVTIVALRLGEGPGVLVQIEAGTERLLSRITRRSADALGLAPGLECFAVIKSVSVAQTDIGGPATG